MSTTLFEHLFRKTQALAGACAEDHYADILGYYQVYTTEEALLLSGTTSRYVTGKRRHPAPLIGRLVDNEYPRCPRMLMHILEDYLRWSAIDLRMLADVLQECYMCIPKVDRHWLDTAPAPYSADLSSQRTRVAYRWTCILWYAICNPWVIVD